MLLGVAVAFAAVVNGQSEDLARYVRTDTGSINGGNTFPGVSWPLGMVKLGPDLENGVDSYSGYQPNGNFTGFSMLHESGTGGAPKYGVVSQLPVPGNISNPLNNLQATRASADVTEVGYYRSSLGSGVTVELCSTRKAGLYRYTFPNASSPNVVVDVSHVLPSYRGQGLGQNYLGGRIDIKEEQPGDFHYEGYGIYDNGWNRAGPWRIYFCGYFDQPATYQTFISGGRTNSTLVEYGDERTYESTEARLGAVFSFEDTIIHSRVGVSFISEAQACTNVNEQIPDGTSLEVVREEARAAWNAEVLSKITTTDTNETMKTQLYTAMYFMNLLPTNKTGENPLWESTEPYYDDIFTFWDTFRCTTSLLHILQPRAYEEFIRSLIDIWRHEGYVSDARSSHWSGAVQGGSNSDTVLADAYVKGVRGEINWDDGFASMVKNAEVTPPNDDDPRDPSGSVKEGRGALPDWLEHGFITPRFTRSVSRAVEYAGNDFGLYQVARGLGLDDDARRYLERSRNWRNQWNPDMTALGHSGFLGPRNLTGFIAQNPMSCNGCYWGDYYYQALPWEYSFNAHHDMSTIVSLVGGRDMFIDRLEKLFTPGLFSGNGQFGNTMFNPGNEPSFGSPFLYNFVNRQDLTVRRSRFVAKSYYSPTPGGLPGNSDAGAMESWLLWNIIGLYPLTGQTTFLIASPWFKDLTIHLGGCKTLHITTTGGSEDVFYVQSLKVNGEDWNKSWVSWSDVFANGGTLEFVLGESPANWTTGALPPSPASNGVLDLQM
ncbi:hypothetical protein S40288_08871 [Stachybotrys chartarum IBT 40288]|nr:hypothetical protein S40288_08871 [Stachybotrys chartarum IBT 40288]